MVELDHFDIVFDGNEFVDAMNALHIWLGDGERVESDDLASHIPKPLGVRVGHHQARQHNQVLDERRDFGSITCHLREYFVIVRP